MSSFAINTSGCASFKMVWKVFILNFYVLLPNSINLNLVWNGIWLLTKQNYGNQITFLMIIFKYSLTGRLLISLFRRKESLREKCPNTEFSWSVFSSIRTRKNSVFGLFSRSVLFSIWGILMNVIHCTGNCGFGHIYWRNP